MNKSTIVLQTDFNEDLLPFSVMLHSRGIRHRIFEDGGRQVLALADAAQREAVLALYRDWRSGALDIRIERRPAPPLMRSLLGGGARWRGAPVTLVLLALSLAGFATVCLLNAPGLVAEFTYLPFTVSGNSVRFYPLGDEYWRLITPAFLHFGWLHIAFNGIWLWELGARIERVLGSFNMLGLFLVVAALSNSAQYLFGGPGIFGGMSGVVYGLLGFAWVGGSVQPQWAIRPRSSIMLLMLGWLVLCLVGLVEAAGFGAVANAAHVGGLLSGAALGAIFGIQSRLRAARDTAGR